MANKEGARRHGKPGVKFICVNLLPDVCRLPNGTPVPFSIVAWLDDSIRFSPDVNFAGHPAMTLAGRIAQVHGDEPGKKGGIVSGVNKGHCIPITYSPTVRVDGNNVLYDIGTRMWMNCAGPDARPGNTLGKIIYQEAKGTANISAEGTTPPLQPETPAEHDAWGNAFAPGPGGCTTPPGMGGLLEQGEDGLFGWLNKGIELSRVDWSNPGAVLGALGGIADKAGFGGLASGLGKLRYGYKLIKETDWRNPAAALGALGGLAGRAGNTSLAQGFGFLAQGAKLIHTDWRNPKAVLKALAGLADNKILRHLGAALPSSSRGPSGPTNPPLQPQTTAERRHADPERFHRLFGADGTIAMAHAAARIIGTDWHSPSAVLGTLAPVTDMARLNRLDDALGILQRVATPLSRIDWHHPAAARRGADQIAAALGIASLDPATTADCEKARTLRRLHRHSGDTLGRLTDHAAGGELNAIAQRIQRAAAALPEGYEPFATDARTLHLIRLAYPQRPARPRPRPPAPRTHDAIRRWLRPLERTLYRPPEHLDVTPLREAPWLDATGAILGDTDPPVRPETPAERLAGVLKVIAHNPRHSATAPVKIDAQGRWRAAAGVRAQTQAEARHLRALMRQESTDVR